MKTYLLDANVVLWFLTQDNPVQSKAATALFEKAKKKEVVLELDAVMLAEVIYLLDGYYKRSRQDIASILLRLVSSPGIQVKNQTTVVNALLRFKNEPVDFPDAWLAAQAAESKTPAASFDEDLDRFPDVTRYEPKA